MYAAVQRLEDQKEANREYLVKLAEQQTAEEVQRTIRSLSRDTVSDYQSYLDAPRKSLVSEDGLMRLTPKNSPRFNQDAL